MQQQPQFYQQIPNPPPTPKKKGSGKCLPIGCTSLIVLVIVLGIVTTVGKSNASTDTTASPSTQVNTVAQPTDTPTEQPTVAPTQPPVPTESPAQTERAYKAGTTDTTVINLDKDGANDMAKQVHFTAKIIGFVKDDSGNTAGANVDTPDSYSSSIIQVEFPSNADISRLNQDDVIEVWGIDDGVSSGKNAFGGTVQEVAISSLYMIDQTTGYQANG